MFVMFAVGIPVGASVVVGAIVGARSDVGKRAGRARVYGVGAFVVVGASGPWAPPSGSVPVAGLTEDDCAA